MELKIAESKPNKSNQMLLRDVKRTTAEGTYKIQEVTFKGDSREGDWVSSVKGRIVNG